MFSELRPLTSQNSADEAPIALSLDREERSALADKLIDSLGGELRDVYISELRDHTYFAKLRIRMNGELVEVDSRPSDAIALAVTANVPIYVAEDVLEEVCGNE